MKGFSTGAAHKLVPINHSAAADCAREGRTTGAGYYKTVNMRVADYPRVEAAAHSMAGALRYIKLLWLQDEPIEKSDMAIVDKALQGAPADNSPAAGILRAMGAEFPGLLNGDDDVNGADLIEWLGSHTATLHTVCGYVEPPEALEVCTDCLQVVAGCTDNLDADRQGEILAAIERHGGHLSPGDRIDEFSACRCELCGSGLAGERHIIYSTGGAA